MSTRFHAMDPMPAPLLFDFTPPADEAWRAAVWRAVAPATAARDRHNLVQAVAVEAPEQIICLATGLDDALAAALSAWDGAPPCAVLLLTPPHAIDAAAAMRVFELGIAHWQAIAPSHEDAETSLALANALAIAQARHRRDDAHRHALARAQSQLDDRRWIDRAKGLLMSARGLDEAQAFGLLRGTAMSVNQRIGEVSRAVFEAAQWADAMNRAGQLRMLSQRLVRTAAQRLLRIDPRGAEALESRSVQRVHDNLELLARHCARTSAQEACDDTTRHWRALATALAPRLDASALVRIDTLATALLDSAERLTQALQQASGRRALDVVNECGRQRMRVQRLAKEELIAALAPASARVARDDALVADFETAQHALELTPLSSPEIRATQARVRDEWHRLRVALRASGTRDGRRALVDASDGLVDLLDALTAACEHSLQVILG